MKKRRVWISIFIVALILLVSALLGAMLQPDNSNEFIVAVISLAVAILALYISLRTFVSIDEVNAISRMDGNVMENSRYQPNVLRSIVQFPQVEFSEASESIMMYMEQLFETKEQLSGARLADNVQEVADLMVLVPFFIRTNNSVNSAIHLRRVEQLIHRMKSAVNNFKSISDGSCKLLEETINLIEAVFAYQNLSAGKKTDPSKLLELRGSIFVNPVSIVLYNNYLGLYFLRKAETIHSSGTTRSLSATINSYSCVDPETKSLSLIYLQQALDSFQKARENVGRDQIWRAFVNFNIARTMYTMLCLGEDKVSLFKFNDWHQVINESIRCWITTNRMVAEHFSEQVPEGKISWLQQALLSQERKVRLTKIIYQMKRGESITDPNGNIWVSNSEDILQTSFYKQLPESDPQGRTEDLVKDLVHLVQNKL